MTSSGRACLCMYDLLTAALPVYHVFLSCLIGCSNREAPISSVGSRAMRRARRISFKPPPIWCIRWPAKRKRVLLLTAAWPHQLSSNCQDSERSALSMPKDSHFRSLEVWNLRTHRCSLPSAAVRMGQPDKRSCCLTLAGRATLPSSVGARPISAGPCCRPAVCCRSGLGQQEAGHGGT